MPLIIPTRQNEVDKLRNYVRGELTTLDTSTERRSFIGGLVKALASALADWYIALKRWADREPWPQFATPGGSLYYGWWVPLTKLQPLPPAPAHGYVAVTGVSGAIIPSGTRLQAAGTTFEVQVGATIVAQPITAQALTYDGGLGIASFKSLYPHFLATGMTVSIAGASQAAYNGAFQVTVTGVDSFTYVPVAVPSATPATGTPVATATFAAVLVESTSTGQNTNESSGSLLSIDAAPAGVDSTATVTFGGIAGGTDAESAESYRSRILEALGTDYGMFTGDEIEIVAKQVPGVTRVMVRKAQVYPPQPGYPLEGQVKVAFLRDNDTDSFLPSAQEVADVKNRILSLLMPANTAEEDVIVMSPPPFSVGFTFASITPDTPAMRRAIIAVLQQYFREEAAWGGTITVDDYRCVIRTAYDFESRQRLKSFTLTSPSADIVAGVTAGYDYDDMPVLGTVQFP